MGKSHLGDNLNREQDQDQYQGQDRDQDQEECCSPVPVEVCARDRAEEVSPHESLPLLHPEKNISDGCRTGWDWVGMI